MVSVKKLVFLFRKFFPPGETVIFDGQDYVCEDCDYGVDPSSRQPLHSMSFFFPLYIRKNHSMNVKEPSRRETIFVDKEVLQLGKFRRMGNFTVLIQVYCI